MIRESKDTDPRANADPPLTAPAPTRNATPTELSRLIRMPRVVTAPMHTAPPEVPANQSRLRPAARLDGPELQRRLKALGERLLPPVPDARMISTVSVPGPADVPANATDAEAVAMLARAYRGAVERTFGTVSMFMLRGEDAKHKDFERLLFAARTMQVAGIPPAAWVLFSFSVWREFGPEKTRGKHPPTVAFVFSGKRLLERADWFEEERDRWVGGQMLMSSEHRALCEDHKAMWRELMVVAPDTRDGVRAVVERWFPGQEWERRVAVARAQSLELKLRVREQVGLGCVLWDERRG